MKNKILIALSGIWVILVFLAGTSFSDLFSRPSEYLPVNDYVKRDGMYYISDNKRDDGIIYGLNDNGSTRYLFLTSEHPLLMKHNIRFMDLRDDLENEDIVVLLEYQAPLNGLMVTAYKIMEMDDKLTPLYITDPFVLADGLKVSDLSVEGKDFYISALSDDGQRAYVYRIPDSNLYEMPSELAKEEKEQKSAAPKEEENFITPERIIMEHAESMRFFSQASYINSELILRSDYQPPIKALEPPQEVRDLAKNRSLAMGQRFRVSGISVTLLLFFCIVGVLAMFLIFTLLSDKNRLIYEIFIYEGVLVAVVVVAFCFVLFQKTQFTMDGRLNTAKNTMNSIFLDFDSFADAELRTDYFYDSFLYVSLQGAIAQRMSVTTGLGAVDMCVMDVDSGNLLVSASGRNQQPISQLYGEKVQEFVQKTAAEGAFATDQVMIQGITYSIYCQPLTRWHLDDSAAVMICRYVGTEDLFNGIASLAVFALITFLVGSVFGIILLISQQRDLRELAAVLKQQAEGKTDEMKKPKLRGVECNSMWNSICEIQKNIMAMNRVKFLTFEAYFRFAPKNIEQILNRESILDVNRGDVTNLNGTLALFVNKGIQSGWRADMEQLNQYFSFLEKSMEGQNGILISASNDLSLVKLLFMEECRGSAAFGRELLHTIMSESHKEMPDGAVFLHYAPFTYGIAGTDKHSFAFIVSPEGDVMQKYSGWLTSLRVSLVISETVLEREEISGVCRYIGFVREDNIKIRLYEVLDACSARIRHAKMELRAQFESALELFYNKDFYFARNQFMEILQRLPEDGLSKWYLFECESFLNRNDPEHFDGRLHL